MNFFTTAQHVNELRNLLSPGLGFFDILNSEQNGIPVLAIERRKKRLGPGVCVKRLLQIVWHGRPTCGRVRALPSSIFLGVLNGPQASRQGKQPSSR